MKNKKKIISTILFSFGALLILADNRNLRNELIKKDVQIDDLKNIIEGQQVHLERAYYNLGKKMRGK